MTALRSLLFNLCFYGWTGVLCILALPALLLPRSVLIIGGHVWARGTVALLRHIVGLRHQLRGVENRAHGGAIYALKHQSAWETLLLPVLFQDPMIVLKRELIFLPLFGWYLVKTGQIAVDRSGRAAALKRMMREAKAGMWQGAFIAPWDWRVRNKKTTILGAAKAPETAHAILLASASGSVAPSPECTIKGNVNRAGECIYHTPKSRWYAKIEMKISKGTRWFCSVDEAEAAGCRETKR